MRIFYKRKREGKSMRRNKNMYRPSLLSCVLHHPIVYIKTYIKVFIVVGIVLSLLGQGSVTDSEFKMCLVIIGLIALSMMRGAVEKMEEKRNEPRRPSIIGTLLGSAIGSAIDSSNRRSDAFQRSMSDAISNSFSSNSSYDDARRAQQRQADMNARARWDAMDRQKKAEWDARDAALRGKDKAAYHYQNQADYWRKQSKR